MGDKCLKFLVSVLAQLEGNETVYKGFFQFSNDFKQGQRLNLLFSTFNARGTSEFVCNSTDRAGALLTLKRKRSRF